MFKSLKVCECWSCCQPALRCLRRKILFGEEDGTFTLPVCVPRLFLPSLSFHRQREEEGGEGCLFPSFPPLGRGSGRSRNPQPVIPARSIVRQRSSNLNFPQFPCTGAGWLGSTTRPSSSPRLGTTSRHGRSGKGVHTTPPVGRTPHPRTARNSSFTGVTELASLLQIKMRQGLGHTTWAWPGGVGGAAGKEEFTPGVGKVRAIKSVVRPRTSSLRVEL